MNKVDLHIHSIYSDGSMTIDEIFALAKEENLSRLCITDHDALAPWEEICAARDNYHVDTLTGIELSCLDPKSGRSVHLLGYGFAPTAPHIRAYCEKISLRRRAQNARQIATLSELGYTLSSEVVAREMALRGVLTKQQILQMLIDAGYTDKMYSSLFFSLFGPGGALREADESPSYEEGMQAILADGGKVSLAHPGMDALWDLVPTLKRLGLSGIEAHHPVHSTEDERKAVALAKEQDLFITGGSDFHGANSYIPRRLAECHSQWLNDPAPPNRLFFARSIIEKASKIARNLSLRPFTFSDKGEMDWVSEVDLAVQELIVSEIKRRYPEDTIVSEEMDLPESHSGYRWILDPIDGTRNLLYDRENFCISLALYDGDEPMLAVLSEPKKEALFTGEAGKGVRRNGLPLEDLSPTSLRKSLLENGTRGDLPDELLYKVQATRYSGSIAKSLLLLVTGNRHIVISDKAKVWDYAGGVALIKELGGEVLIYPGKGKGESDYLIAAVREELAKEVASIIGIE